MPVRSFRRALVTGASGGIGEALARELAAAGTHLVLVARSADALERLAAELRRHVGLEVEVLVADLLSDDLASVEQRLRRTDAPIDLLVNNAGMGQVGPFAELDLDTAERQVRLNALAPIRLTRCVLPRLMELGGGVLTVSSVAASQPVPMMATYAATKAFVSSWSQSLHEELRHAPVHVTLLAPGFTRTEFAASAGGRDEAGGIPDRVWSDPAAVARAGLEGVARGRALVVPGALYRAGVAVSDVTPAAVTRRVVGTATRWLRR